MVGRLTIELAETTHSALRQEAARRNRSIASIVEESLRMRGIPQAKSVQSIVAKARAQAGLDAAEADAIALEETARYRMGRR